MLVKTEDGSYLNLLGCHLTYRTATSKEEKETNTDAQVLSFVVVKPLEERVGLEYIVARVLSQKHAKQVIDAMINAMSHDHGVFDSAVVSDLFLYKKEPETESEQED